MIKLKNVKKHYKDFNLNISLEIPNGRVTGLIGKNGSGKSTTIKAILGLVKANEGEIEIFGKDINKLTNQDRQLIGVALSDSGFSNYLTVNNIATILDKMYSSFNKIDFLKQCSQRGLAKDKYLQHYSTGMKATLRVLVALSHHSKLLIMDEPTAGMDVEARKQIIDIIRNYLKDNPDCSVLITSHIATDLEGICDDVYLIDKGSIILHEDCDVIASQYGILKPDEQQYRCLDKTYLKKTVQDKFCYRCLTNERNYYHENYPDIVIERCGIDELILMLTGA